MNLKDPCAFGTLQLGCDMSDSPIFENDLYIAENFSVSTLRLAIKLIAAKDEYGYEFWEEYRYSNGNKMYMFGLADESGDGDLLITPSGANYWFRENRKNYEVFVSSRLRTADLTCPLREYDTTPLIDRALDTCDKLKANMDMVSKIRKELDNISKTDEELFEMLFPVMGVTSDL